MDSLTHSAAALNLRPLPLGELLDRAFHLYFRNIVAFSALLAVVLVPSILVTYFQSRDILSFYFALIQHQVAAPNSPPDLSKLSSYAPSDLLTILQFTIAIFVIPIAYGAVVVGVSRAYVGLPVTFSDSYRQALRRWLPILILITLWIVLVVVAVFAFAIGAAVLIPTSILVTRALGGGAFFGILLALFLIALTVAAVGFVIMLYLTSAVSFISVVLENVDPVQAFGNAFGRVFGGGQFWRGFVLAMALTGIYFGGSLVIGGGGAVLSYLLKEPALYIIFAGLLQLFFVPFAVVTAAVYYYDIRIRREGYDLQMLIDRFAGPTTPPAGSSA